MTFVREHAECEVGLNVSECENRFGERIRTRCYACGQTACRECSRLTTEYRAGRRVRLCNDCAEDHGLPTTGDIADAASRKAED